MDHGFFFCVFIFDVSALKNGEFHVGVIAVLHAVPGTRLGHKVRHRRRCNAFPPFTAALVSFAKPRFAVAFALGESGRAAAFSRSSLIELFENKRTNRRLFFRTNAKNEDRVKHWRDQDRFNIQKNPYPSKRLHPRAADKITREHNKSKKRKAHQREGFHKLPAIPRVFAHIDAIVDHRCQ